VIGESDPEGCAACQGPHLQYRNTTMYSSYTAASFARKHDLAERHGVNLEGALTWAFQFEDTPYFAGFRALATNGITLPVFNVFRMFSRMGSQRIAAISDHAVDLNGIVKQGVRERPDVAALASRDANRATILAWHYHDDDVPGPAAEVSLTIEGLGLQSGTATLKHFRVDADHSNAYTVWQRMGSPQSPSTAQYERLESASELAMLEGPTRLTVADGRASLALTLPRQAVSLLVVEW
jgi:xylan 1,4-beta-xylosidase